MTVFMIFASLALLGIVGYGLQIAAVHAALSRSPGETPSSRQLPTDDLPPVSILKPLKGIDDRLFDNLESFCLQDYPQYEIIFALQDHNDPAYKVACTVRDRYPDRDIRVLVRRCDEGLNPKVNNLMPAYDTTKYNLVLISDSNVMVKENYLRDIARHMQDPSVGLVSNPIRGTMGRSAGSVLENLHLNSFVLGSVCFLDRFLKMPCVVGKSMLMRKSDLSAIGGLEGVKDVLAEDYVIGERMHRAGRKVVLSDHLINNVNEYWGVRKFLNRHVRWGKLRWKIGGMKYLSELFTNGVFMSLLALLFCGPTRLSISMAVFVSSVKVACDFYLGKKLNTRMHPLLYLLAPLKDLIVGLIWFVPLVSNTIVWRGNKYIIGKNSVLSAYPEIGLLPWKMRIVYAIKTRFA
jgi:ceramide glucosyltransferase